MSSGLIRNKNSFRACFKSMDPLNILTWKENVKRDRSNKDRLSNRDEFEMTANTNLSESVDHPWPRCHIG